MPQVIIKLVPLGSYSVQRPPLSSPIRCPVVLYEQVSRTAIGEEVGRRHAKWNRKKRKKKNAENPFESGSNKTAPYHRANNFARQFIIYTKELVEPPAACHSNAHHRWHQIPTFCANGVTLWPSHILHILLQSSGVNFELSSPSSSPSYSDVSGKILI